MNLSKSKYVNGIQCKKMLWLDKNKPEKKSDLDNESVLKNGNFIHEVAKYLFGEHINIDFSENLDEMINNTNLTIESYENVIITEASFKYKNNFCSVDILKKNGNKYEMYEVKGSTNVKDIYLKDASYQYYVLSNIGLNITKVSIVHLNNKYVRRGYLDLNKLFIKNDITSEILNLQLEVENNIEEINKYMDIETEPSFDIGTHCFEPYKCPFFKYCSRHLPEHNVFDIHNLNIDKKEKLYKQGFYKYEDLIDKITNKNQLMQIEYIIYNKDDYINKREIKKFMQTLKEPLYFFDFETFQLPIPLYDNLKPYEKIPCQYSLHIMQNGNLEHKEYLAESGIDPRRDLALKLIQDIPLNSCVLVYNMRFEKGIIRELAKLYPDLSEHLMNIHDNIKDLMLPFEKKWYYTKNMQGSYSIKYVLPALFPNDESLNYHNLDLIHNGAEAMSEFADLENKSQEEQSYIRERLLRYCELDTFAMVKIYEKLLNII